MSGRYTELKLHALLDPFFRVDDATGCWIWTGRRSPQQYGRLYCDRRYFFAHRVAYEVTNGPIPDRLIICHKCDRPPCINPDHLFAGTHADNTRDMMRKGRAGFPTAHSKKVPKYAGRMEDHYLIDSQMLEQSAAPEAISLREMHDI